MAATTRPAGCRYCKRDAVVLLTARQPAGSPAEVQYRALAVCDQHRDRGRNWVGAAGQVRETPVQPPAEPAPPPGDQTALF